MPRAFAMKVWFAAVSILMTLVARSPAYQLNEAEVRDVLSKAMRCQNITQLHSVVVHGDASLYEFRLRLNSDDTVSNITTRTLMPIASVSKGMFCTALVKLEEHLRAQNPSFNLFTTPIKKFMGDDFWYLDQQRTDAVTLQDLLSHSTGLHRHDTMTMLGDARTKEEVYRRTGRLQPSLDFRASFIYNNLAFSVADYVVEKLTGKNFTTYMREFLWRPLGMNDTRGSTEIFEEQIRSTFAGVDRSEYRSLLDRTLDVSEAAGGIFLSLDDMIKYMRYHIRQLNASDLAPSPMPFKAVNGHWTDIQAFFNQKLYNDPISMPKNHYESYGYGWIRAWYRDNLVYEHGGSYLSARTELEIYPERALGVFTNTLLGSTEHPMAQAGYAFVLNKYIADLLLQATPFVTNDNVCSLFRTPGYLLPVPRRSLTSAETEMCIGSFGDFGFGTVSVFKNATSGSLNARYGFVTVELLPVTYRQPSTTIEFFATILAPPEMDIKTEVVDTNSTHVTITTAPLRVPSFLFTVRQEGGKVYLNSPLFDSSMNLQKGLEPAKWQRPERCPSGGGVTGLTISTTSLLTSAVAVTAVGVFGCV